MRTIQQTEAGARQDWARDQISEAERRDRQELSRTVHNDQRLFTPTRCRVLKSSFCVGGRPVELGSVFELPRHDAESLKALGKVEII